ncbi:MAG: hypothetical protein ACYC4Q_06610 [Victivallaceae bacterium]
MMVVVCQKCRCSNQFGTLFCRNCGEKLKIVDQNHPDFKASVAIKKVLFKIINLVVVFGFIAFVGALFVPFGLPPEKVLSGEDIKKAKEDCDAIDSALASGRGSVVFTFNPERASWGMNYLLDEKRPMPPVPAVRSNFGSSSRVSGASVSAQSARSSASPAISRSPLQSRSSGPMKLSSEGGALQSRSSGPMKLSSEGGALKSRSSGAGKLSEIPAPQPQPAEAAPAPTQAEQAVEATPEAGVWKGHSGPQTHKAEAAAPADSIFTSKYEVGINKNMEVSVILAGKMLYYLPYRLELVGELKDSEPDKDGNTKPSFTLKKTKFGHITFPSFLKNQGIELFKLMASDKKIKAYGDRIKAINVESEDAIQVTVQR